MKAMKVIVIVILVYAGIVVAFESLLGYYQPEGQGTVLITTIDESGDPHERVVSRLQSDGALYIAANHWPRAWYRQALENPQVQVSVDGQTGMYQARPVTGAEHDRVDREHPLGLGIRFLTGFPPRHFVRLDPV